MIVAVDVQGRGGGGGVEGEVAAAARDGAVVKLATEGLKGRNNAAGAQGLVAAAAVAAAIAAAALVVVLMMMVRVAGPLLLWLARGALLLLGSSRE